MHADRRGNRGTLRRTDDPGRVPRVRRTVASGSTTTTRCMKIKINPRALAVTLAWLGLVVLVAQLPSDKEGRPLGRILVTPIGWALLAIGGALLAGLATWMATIARPWISAILRRAFIGMVVVGAVMGALVIGPLWTLVVIAACGLGTVWWMLVAAREKERH